jgi:hypothetical protein
MSFMRRLLVITAAAAGACVLVLSAAGAAGPINLGSYFFGPKLVRAEIVMSDGGVHDYLVDRGKIRASGGGSITMLEKDGTVVTIPVASSADIRYKGVAVLLSRLRRGMTATTIREGTGPATTVVATP